MISANALRLGSLVAAAMASGYLWRAAMEPRAATKVLRVSAPSAGFRVPGTLINPFARLPIVHGEAVQSRAASRAPTRPKAQGIAAAARPADTEVLVAVTAPAPPRTQTRSAPPRRARRTVRPIRARVPRRPAPKPAPKPAPPPPAVPAPPPPPAQPPSPQPPPPAPPPPPPVVRPGDDRGKGRESRPGWGHGDPNHEHTGPPGQQKQKNNKR